MLVVMAALVVEVGVGILGEGVVVVEVEGAAMFVKGNLCLQKKKIF